MLGGSDNVTPTPTSVLRPLTATPLIVSAEHAGRAVPERLVIKELPLGIALDQMETHIAFDIGVDGVARHLSSRLDATAILANYSRLVIDLNRPLGDPESILTSSDGTRIPSNESLSEAEFVERGTYFWSYHNAIDLAIAQHRRSYGTPLLLSLHSFTPRLRNAGTERRWHVGVMFDTDTRLSHPLAKALAAEGLEVGFNEPYSGVTSGYSVKRHGLAQGLPHVQLEIRQDLISSPGEQEWWGSLLATVFGRLVSEVDLAGVG